MQLIDLECPKSKIFRVLISAPECISLVENVQKIKEFSKHTLANAIYY